jgi:hypothetical protein
MQPMFTRAWYWTLYWAQMNAVHILVSLQFMLMLFSHFCLSLWVNSSLQVFQPKCCMHFSSVLWMLHAMLISSFCRYWIVWIFFFQNLNTLEQKTTLKVHDKVKIRLNKGNSYYYSVQLLFSSHILLNIQVWKEHSGTVVGIVNNFLLVSKRNYDFNIVPSHVLHVFQCSWKVTCH